MISPTEFDAIIADALDDLPPFFAAAMNNVVVLAAEWPSRRELRDAGLDHNHTLLGLYSGIPLTERTQGYTLVPPDTITLYQGPLEQTVAAELRPGEVYVDLLRDAIRHTVIHEIAHHFGISDDRLVELGAY
jgi:predicted Zn-dependent protease with MMP-like domain